MGGTCHILVLQFLVHTCRTEKGHGSYSIGNPLNLRKVTETFYLDGDSKNTF